jgi:hypothetical protein
MKRAKPVMMSERTRDHGLNHGHKTRILTDPFLVNNDSLQFWSLKTAEQKSILDQTITTEGFGAKMLKIQFYKLVENNVLWMHPL